MTGGQIRSSSSQGRTFILWRQHLMTGNCPTSQKWLINLSCVQQGNSVCPKELSEQARASAHRHMVFVSTGLGLTHQGSNEPQTASEPSPKPTHSLLVITKKTLQNYLITRKFDNRRTHRLDKNYLLLIIANARRLQKNTFTNKIDTNI